MSNMTFYLKYRPQNLEDLDLDSVREQLKKIVSSGNIPPALLFAGPKGTGKTSAARIIAKIVNCERIAYRGQRIGEPCNKCSQCISIMKGNNIDVIELDAASNRGIDDARALRGNIKLAPAKARKKVYIIDEAHMLTTEASNVLLKTLEEPPSHVMLILATTNPEKLIETIRSRTTLINFTKATFQEILRSLSRVVKGEKLKMDKKTLLLIAEAARGSFRDAAKILEQVASQGPEFLSKTKTFDPDKFIEILVKKDVKSALCSVEEFIRKGISAENITEALLLRLREALLAKVGIGENDLAELDRDDLICLIKLLLKASRQIPASAIEQLPLELAIVAWCGEEAAPEPVPEPTKAIDKPGPKLKEIKDEVWKNILATVRPINTSIEALLRAARPIGFDGKTLTLGVYYRFHKERLEENEHRQILEDVVAGILGGPVRIACILTNPPVKKPVESSLDLSSPAGALTPSDEVLTESPNSDIIKIAEEIFGN